MKSQFLARTLLLICCSVVPLVSVDFDGMLLEKITIISNVNISDRSITASLDLELGEPLSRSLLRQRFRELYSLGMFNDLKFYVNVLGDDGAELLVVVDELSRVSDIRFVGNQKFSSDELTTEFPLAAGDYYSESRINQAILFIQDKYREEGYLATKISYTTEERESTKETIITFDIDEGAEMLVGQIHFVGNTIIKERYLKREMETKEDRWFREGKFDDAVLEEDKLKIIKFYQKKGYLNVTIDRTRITYRWKNPRRKKAREAHITFWLTEGEKFFFGSVEIQGNTLFTVEELRKKLKRKQGEVFNQEIHEADIQAISSLYHDRGYIFMRITPLETIDRETMQVSYVFDIYEGDKAHVEKIFIVGNDKTRDNVVRRELVIREGEIFSADKIRTSTENLMRTGFFKNVIPEPKQGSVEGLMNLTFRVEEQQTGMVQAGAGYGTKSKWSLNFELSEKNLGGRGLSAGIRANVGQKEQNISVNFTEPYLARTPVSLGLRFAFVNETLPNLDINTYILTNSDGTTSLERHNIVYVDESTNVIETNALEYTHQKFSWSLFLGYRFFNFWRINTENTYSIERDVYSEYDGFGQWSRVSQAEIYQANVGKVDPFDDEWLRVYMSGITLSRDSRNQTLNPSRGSYLNLNTDFFLTGHKLTKTSFKFSIFKTLFWRLIWMGRVDFRTQGRLGKYYEYDDKLNYYFYREELRGWGYSDVEDFIYDVTREQYKYMSGKARVLYTTELRVPIIDYFAISSFLDAGALHHNMVSTDPDDLTFLYNPYYMMFSYGLGLNVNIPMFPIRLYVAYRFRLNPVTGEIDMFFNHNETFGDSEVPKPEFIFTVAGFF